jgi:hypothetical protein
MQKLHDITQLNAFKPTMRVAFIVALAVLLPLAAAEYCNGKPAPGERVNSNPLIDANPQFAAQVANGKLFWAGPSGMMISF